MAQGGGWLRRPPAMMGRQWPLGPATAASMSGAWTTPAGRGAAARRTGTPASQTCARCAGPPEALSPTMQWAGCRMCMHHQLACRLAGPRADTATRIAPPAVCTACCALPSRLEHVAHQSETARCAGVAQCRVCAGRGVLGPVPAGLHHTARRPGGLGPAHERRRLGAAQPP